MDHQEFDYYYGDESKAGAVIGDVRLCRTPGRVKNPYEYGRLSKMPGWIFGVQWQRIVDRARQNQHGAGNVLPVLCSALAL